jgi:hypothetical protein
VILNRTAQSDERSVAQLAEDATGIRPHLTRGAEVLAELYELLEEYAPSWYRPQHHERAESALRLLREH